MMKVIAIKLLSRGSRAVALALCLVVVSSPASAQAPPADARAPYLDPSLPLDRRVADLLSRMTLEEKVSQMMNAAPAIPRPLADVLFGDYNPAGRLPVTFYKSVEQLPPFESYAMEGRTYRFFKGQPLYPFGHGLSYTRFRYSGLSFTQARVSPNDKVTVSATVENAGRVEGDEVVQLYVRDVEASARVPVRSLAGVERVRLKPGERRAVSFTFDPRQLAVIRDDGRAVVEPGEFRVSVGGKQPGFAGTADTSTTSFVEGHFTVVGAPTEVKR